MKPLVDFKAIQNALDVWGPLLSRIQHKCPSAVIAGGALRDLWFGGAIKDIDVFVPVGESGGQCPINIPGVRLHSELLAAYIPTFRDEVHRVAEFHVPGTGLPVQVIHMNLPSEGFEEAVTSRMDFDVCRVSWDGHRMLGQAMLTEALHAKRMTIVRCEDYTQALRSLRRGASFKARYPDWFIDTTLALGVLSGSLSE